MGGATHVDKPPRPATLRSRRLLRLAGDDRLVQQIRRGSEPAFEVAFERHAPAILGFCRHMLGSPEEAEDVVQHTFAAAWGDLQRADERAIALKPWLFAIARNRCVSVLRARREQAAETPEIATAGLAEQVERRAELRQLVADVRELPDEQREALLLAEVGDLPQAEIARIMGCEVARVKGLVYRARSALIARRDARELSCEGVREQLATLRGGSLRRNDLRLHLRECPGCREFREQVRRQRQLLSAALPVVPTLGLKSSVLAATGVGAAGVGAAGGGGMAAGLAGGGSVAAKLAVAGALAVGAGGTAVIVEEHDSGRAPDAPAAASPRPDAAHAVPGASIRALPPSADPRPEQPAAPGRVRDNGHRSHGRGPIDAPPRQTPVRRGPPEGKGKPEHAEQTPRGLAKGRGHSPAAPGVDRGGPQAGKSGGERKSGAGERGAGERGAADPDPPADAPPAGAGGKAQAKGHAKREAR